MATVYTASVTTATTAGLAGCCSTGDKTVTFYANKIPSAEIQV